MKNYYSISESPSTHGARYYRYFFAKYNISATYTPVGCKPQDFLQCWRSLVRPETAGISISMPYKARVRDLVDSVDASVGRYNSCNTVVFNDGHSTGHNTDINGVGAFVRDIPQTATITILGAGTMGKMFHAYLAEHKYEHVNIFSRRLDNWSSRIASANVVINCTACGTRDHTSPMQELPRDCTRVLDLARQPGDLARIAQHHGATYVGGAEFYRHVFAQQWQYYTGRTLGAAEYKEAAVELQKI